MRKQGCIYGLLLAVWICLLGGCGRQMSVQEGGESLAVDSELSFEESTESSSSEEKPATSIPPMGEEPSAPWEVQIIDPSGMTVQTRFQTSDGFERVSAEEGSFGEFLREYPVKEDESPVLLYDGRKKGNQSAHAAVLALPIENRDLQQCADSVMRMYGEYFYATGQYERICFYFVSGFAAEYDKWREGYRISVKGNDVSWVKTEQYDDSYETFVKYMRMVFAYASTLSMVRESEEVSLEEIQAGDVFLKGGSPGHVVMVVDVCENQQGQKAFLLAQGYMPAQEFHVLKNPAHEEDPWYYMEEVSYPFETPEYVFSQGSLRRMKY